MTAAPDITLCMVARGACPLMRQAIRSVSTMVSEIIVIDAGMTPETAKELSDCCAEVYFHPWEEDWSAPWNLALAKATGEWVLALKPSETIAAQDLSFLQHLAVDTGYSFSFSIRHYTNRLDSGFVKRVAGEYYECELDFAGFFETDEVRLFPRKKEIRFEGRERPSVAGSIHNGTENRTVRSRIPFHSHNTGESVCLHQNDGTAAEQDWRNHFDRGLRYKQASKFDEALMALFAAIDCDPRNFRSWLNAGYVLSRLRRYEEAVSAFEAAISIDKNSHEAYCGLGIVALWQKNYPFAERCFRQSVSLNDKYVDGYCNLGKTLVLMGKQRDAERMFLRALKLTPQSGMIKADLGVLYLTQRQLVKAEQLLIQAVQDDPTLAKGYYDLCQVYKAKNDIQSAQSAMQKYLELARRRLAASSSEEYRQTIERAERELLILQKRARI